MYTHKNLMTEVELAISSYHCARSVVYTPLLIFMHVYVTILTQNEAIGATTASGGGRAPMASFWVRIMTSCMNIK